MGSLRKTEVIMKDGSTALAVDVLDTLISSEVTNTIAQITGEYDLSNTKDIMTLSEMIAYYLEISTGIYIHPKQVTDEFQKQLKVS